MSFCMYKRTTKGFRCVPIGKRHRKLYIASGLGGSSHEDLVWEVHGVANEATRFEERSKARS